MKEKEIRSALLLVLGVAGLSYAGRLFAGRILRGSQVYRNDSLGDGRFHSTRHGHLHEGVDIVANSEPVYSPVDGIVERIAVPYPGDDRFSGVVLRDDQREWKLFYVDPEVWPGQEIRRGQRLGTSQDVRLKYGQAMQPHVHVEVRRNGQVEDPAQYLRILA